MKLSVCRKLNAVGLHRAAKKQRRFLERVGQVGDDHFADGFAERAVEHETERALGVVLANQNDRALKKRTAQIAAVQQQFAFEKFLRLAHCQCNVHHEFQLAKNKPPANRRNKKRTRNKIPVFLLS